MKLTSTRVDISKEVQARMDQPIRLPIARSVFLSFFRLIKELLTGAIWWNPFNDHLHENLSKAVIDQNRFDLRGLFMLPAFTEEVLHQAKQTYQVFGLIGKNRLLSRYNKPLFAYNPTLIMQLHTAEGYDLETIHSLMNLGAQVIISSWREWGLHLYIPPQEAVIQRILGAAEALEIPVSYPKHLLDLPYH
ncbi:hypothetical protein BWI93_10805 [Siphonobacter sp. BAB-5385]|uniref:hypothetical protein n=1 Tax=Siphonobacter sp. BAB-5385 TaxID=1864822 RepID=UPI000B9E89F0|nr:hypothetical protein [Siphonobacter sp. BAB-5385]OZI08142.1 hypothetical protein BWI93_10805 [Siphonobacter sp. BAB-5385]